MKKTLSIIVITLCMLCMFTSVIKADTSDAIVSPRGLAPYSITATVYISEKGEYGISWHTKDKSSEPVIQITKEKGSFDESLTVVSEIAASEHNGYYAYKGIVTDLEPSTRYYYRVGDKATSVFSESRSFVTSSPESDSFTFFHMTDTQGGYSNWKKVLMSAMSLYDAQLLVHTGDLVDNGAEESDWKSAFKATEEQLGSLLISSVAGSYHESNGTELYENFNFYVPNDQDVNHGIYYSYDYNNVHFTMLDVNDYSEETGTFSDAQIKWLKNDLKKTDKQWKVVGMHWGIYTAGPRYFTQESANLRKNLEPIFDKYNVDLVLFGHDHVYTRTYPIKNGKVIEKPQTIEDQINGVDTTFDLNTGGTVYLLSNTAGNKFYDLSLSDESIKYIAEYDQSYTPMFSAITVEGNKLMINAYIVDTETGEAMLFDTYAMMKTEVAKSFIQQYLLYIIIGACIVVTVVAVVIILFYKKKAREKAENAQK